MWQAGSSHASTTRATLATCFPPPQALEDRANADVKRELDATIKQLKALPKAALTPSNGNGNGASTSTDGSEASRPDGPAPLLARCRELAMQVVVPPALREALATKMAAAGIPVPDSEERWAAALEALKGVWASKYNDRAFYSLRKCGIDSDDVRMAVCVMRVVPARYAFVIHTKNPQTNDAAEVRDAALLALFDLLRRRVYFVQGMRLVVALLTPHTPAAPLDLCRDGQGPGREPRQRHGARQLHRVQRAQGQPGRPARAVLCVEERGHVRVGEPHLQVRLVCLIEQSLVWA